MISFLIIRQNTHTHARTHACTHTPTHTHTNTHNTHTHTNTHTQFKSLKRENIYKLCLCHLEEHISNLACSKG